MLRRVALVNSGLDDVESDERYIWRGLDASSFESAVSCDLPAFPITSRDREIANGAVPAHRDLAELATTDPAGKVEIEIHHLANALELPPKQVAWRLHSLLMRHAQEWHHFLECRVGPDSWLRGLCP